MYTICKTILSDKISEKKFLVQIEKNCKIYQKVKWAALWHLPWLLRGRPRNDPIRQAITSTASHIEQHQNDPVNYGYVDPAAVGCSQIRAKQRGPDTVETSHVTSRNCQAHRTSSAAFRRCSDDTPSPDRLQRREHDGTPATDEGIQTAESIDLSRQHLQRLISWPFGAFFIG